MDVNARSRLAVAIVQSKARADQRLQGAINTLSCIGEMQ